MSGIKKLPPEVRCEIWRLVYKDEHFEVNKWIDMWWNVLPGPYHTPYLKTCRDSRRANELCLDWNVPQPVVLACTGEKECTLLTCPSARPSWPLFLPTIFKNIGQKLHAEIDEALFMHSRFDFTDLEAFNIFIDRCQDRWKACQSGPPLRYVSIKLWNRMGPPLLSRTLQRIGPLRSLHVSLGYRWFLVEYWTRGADWYIEMHRDDLLPVPTLRTRYLRIRGETYMPGPDFPYWLFVEKWYDGHFEETRRVLHDAPEVLE